MIIEIINIDVYQTSVCICVGLDIKGLDDIKDDNPNKFDDEIYKQMKDDISNVDSCDGFASTLKDGSYLMYIREGHESDYRVVIHELFHITNKILFDRGVYYEESAEAWAYLIGYLAESYFNIINK